MSSSVGFSYDELNRICYGAPNGDNLQGKGCSYGELNRLCYGAPNGDNQGIVKKSVLECSDLQNLLLGKILAICVEDYTPESVCNEVAQRILSKEYQYYDYAQEVVGHYGMSFSEAVSPSKADEYYSQSTRSITHIRSNFEPYMAPIDKLRLQLEEIWPSGAQLEEIEENKKMFVGLCRVIDPNKIVLPHQDDIRWDHDLDRVASLSNQLAVNIYLKIPETGGELELWNYGFTKERYNELADGSYGISKEKISSPVLTIAPKVGELIIFNPRNLHSIRPGNQTRLTQSCFIGHRGKEFPLTYWS